MRKYNGKKEWSETPVAIYSLGQDDWFDVNYGLLPPPFLAFSEDKNSIDKLSYYNNQFEDTNVFITETEEFGWGYDDRI